MLTRSEANILRRLKTRRVCLSSGKSQISHAELDTFHRAIQPVMCFAQIFGVMPLVNILHTNPHAVEFRVCSLGMCCTFLFLLFGSKTAIIITSEILQAGVNARSFVGVLFLSNACISCIAFISLAQRWPQLIQHWTRLDLLLLSPPYKLTVTTLQHKIRLLASCFGIVALLEHCLYYVSNYYEYRMYKLHCKPNVTTASFRDYLIEDKFRDLFQHTSYNIILVIWKFFLSGAYTFIWNYLDLFIMLISFGISTRFKQFAQRVLALVGKCVPDALWHDIRLDHIKLCEFMTHVNENLSTIILISILNNMYFICMQLLNIFTKMRYSLNYAYFWFSLIFLLARITGVFMCASKIHDASLLPRKALYMVPSAYWTEEVQRFMQQLTNECIGLTGHRFFYVTRKSFFGMVASIVTYELMLLQFDVSNHHMSLPELCQ